MAGEIITPNMSLPVPGVGVTSGPQYAADINAALTILDSHSHVPGAGVQITPAGININSALSLNGNGLTSIGALTLSPQSSFATTSSIYSLGVDLYYNDGNGNVVRITQTGSVTGSSGTITGLPSGTASASFSSGTFTFQAATSTGANIDGASHIFRNNTSGSKALTVSPPNAMGADYTLVLPSIPTSNASPLLIDTSGNITPTVGSDYYMPAGIINPYGGVSTPSGWLYCDGAAVSRTTYSRLYAAIGDAYGNGDGSTTFNIPDMRGYFLRGVDNGAGLDPDASSRLPSASGGNSGDNVGSSQVNTYTNHSHSISDPGHKHAFQATNSVSGADVRVPTISSVGGGSVTISNNANSGVQNATTNITVLTSGGSTETRPVNIYVNYIIKT